MNNDELLEMNETENTFDNQFKTAVFKRADLKASAVGAIICALLIIVDMIFSSHTNLGAISVYMSMTGTMFIVKYKKLKEKYQLIFGIVNLIFAALSLIIYINKAEKK